MVKYSAIFVLQVHTEYGEELYEDHMDNRMYGLWKFIFIKTSSFWFC